MKELIDEIRFGADVAAQQVGDEQLRVKVSPLFAAFGQVAQQIDHAGADGLVMFNRVLSAGHRYQDDEANAAHRALDERRASAPAALAGDPARSGSAVMRRGLAQWMEWNKMTRLDEMLGRSSLQVTRDPTAFERANYIRTLHSWGRG